MALIRREELADAEAVRAVNLAAFPSTFESKLVDALRDAGKAKISLVANRMEKLLVISSLVPFQSP